MTKTNPELEIATFAGGCFWNVQDAFDKTQGVVETVAGYMGGNTSNPTQEQVRKGGTDHLEAVQVKYDSDKVSYEQLLDVYWSAVPKITIEELESPTGQYKPVLFTHSEMQSMAAFKSLMTSKREGKSLILVPQTSVLPAREFWPEPDEAHQHYYQKHERR